MTRWYILSGSDDFNLYMWRIPKDPEAGGGAGRVVNGAFMVLKGHRSIVNQVRFNPHTYMICSSGVEKVIKMWSPYQQPESLGDLEGRVEDKSRSLYTHEEYISLVLNSGSGLSHDYVSQSIQEDPRMMAFFDSLVRREIEGWSSDSDSDLSEEAIMQLHARGRRTVRPAALALPPPVAAAAASAAPDHQSDSDNSSSSSLAGPDASGGEEPAGEEEEEEEEEEAEAGPRRRRRLLRHQSGFPANDDSDSSEFWLDPVPRPRSPSPRGNSTPSSPASSPSLPAGASSTSASASSSSSGSDDEERRSAVRRRNVVRRRRALVVSRAGERPEAVQTLFSAMDSCSYPSILIDDLSSSSSAEAQNSLKPGAGGVGGGEEDKCLSPSDFVCLSPVMSPESPEEGGRSRTEPERRLAAPRRRTGGHAADGEACGSSAPLDGDSPDGHGPGVNGRHRTAAPRVRENLHVSSGSEEETGVPPGDGRPQRGLALKRTRVGPEELEAGSSPSGKKLKIL
ncbi:DDB1- and CUL4-associated factor 5 [Liparis tanakae]|uniref:DDB1-and CUL4-associated factor 5 n=1 Tax=Liparis tanakae TaxID=230148 RepID=A0A4Z2HKV2_9TELE|nr:DDB1- and CUL4-associated factor 5 [Liparis tanakae]